MTADRSSLGDMDPEDFRREAHRVADWIADYLKESGRYPVLARVRPGEIAASLPSEAPVRGEAFDAIFSDFERVLLPGITHWNHPGFFAYFAITGSAPGILAEFLSAALNVQAMLWRTSPAATELEAVALSWLRKLLGLPETFEGVIYDTASISTLHALAAAREQAVPAVRSQGLAGRGGLPRPRVYCSDQTHSSIDKAVILLGLGHESLRKVQSDAGFRMRSDALEAAVAEDRSNGWQPLAVVATVGTTSSTSVDPVEEIAALCRRESIWLHVDAAYAGVAAMVPGHEWILRGAEHADSLVVNPHKWLFTPFDLSVLFCRRMDLVRAAFALTPEYLTSVEAAPVRNLMDTGIQLGRRFARLFAAWVDESPLFERLAPVHFSVVCFRATGAGNEISDVLNEQIVESVNATGKIFVSHTRLDGRYAIRLAIGNLHTTEHHVALAWQLFQEHAARLRSVV